MAPSAPLAVAGIEVTSPPSTLGMTNGQSTPMRTNPATSEDGFNSTQIYRHRQCQDAYFRIVKFLPIGWDMVCLRSFCANSSGTSQIVNLAGKAPMTSAPPVSLMTQIPQYSTTTTARPVTGNFQMPTFQMPNANSSADPLPTQQRFMT